MRGIVVGTPLYMPPEQRAERRLDARSDLYSVGVVVYETLTGTLPFDVDDVPMLRARGALAAAIPIAVAGSVAGGALGALAGDTVPRRFLESAMATPTVGGEALKPVIDPIDAPVAPITRAAPAPPLPPAPDPTEPTTEPAFPPAIGPATDPEPSLADQRRARVLERRAATAALRARRARAWRGPVVDPWQAPR